MVSPIKRNLSLCYASFTYGFTGPRYLVTANETQQLAQLTQKVFVFVDLGRQNFLALTKFQKRFWRLASHDPK
jgi:hypothetical protein